jgi:hypothetical protein
LSRLLWSLTAAISNSRCRVATELRFVDMTSAPQPL